MAEVASPEGIDQNNGQPPLVPKLPVPPNPFVNNIATLGLIVCSVLGIFALGQGVRKYLRQRKAANAMSKTGELPLIVRRESYTAAPLLIPLMEQCSNWTMKV